MVTARSQQIAIQKERQNVLPTDLLPKICLHFTPPQIHNSSTRTDCVSVLVCVRARACVFPQSIATLGAVISIELNLLTPELLCLIMYSLGSF